MSERIADVLGYVASRNDEHNVDRVRARPALPDVPANWREEFAERLGADHPDNQARRERGLPGNPVVDGLTFASVEEVRVYAALRRIQDSMAAENTIAIAPIPGVRLRAGHTWFPDLVVLGNGRAVVIEVDGPHHATQRRYVSDRNRDLQFMRCGVPVVRMAVQDVQDEAAFDVRLREELRRHLSLA